MIQYESARRMIALIVVAVAAMAQDFVVSEASANRAQLRFHGTAHQGQVLTRPVVPAR